MLDKAIDAIVSSDLQALVTNGTLEARTIEFKRDLPGPKDSDRKEFLADVSSFANAAGGDIVYGVAEHNGQASAADGLSGISADLEVLRFDQMIRSGISPRIVGCQVRAIPGLRHGPAIIVRVPRSWQGPHIVSYQQYFRFFSRNANGKFPMDVSDIRDAVLQSGSVEEKVKLFRAERLAHIVAQETPVQLVGKALTCLHIVPFQAYGHGEQIDLLKAANNSPLLEPFYASGWSAPLFNIDGVFTHTPRSVTGSSTYLQIFRNGIVESVDARMIPNVAPYPPSVPSLAFAQQLFALVQRVTSLYLALDVPSPFVLLVSFLGVRDVQLAVNTGQARGMGLRTIDRDVLMLPELIIQEQPASLPTLMKPLLDALWQSVGAPRCFDYDDAGEWKPTQ